MTERKRPYPPPALSASAARPLPQRRFSGWWLTFTDLLALLVASLVLLYAMGTPKLPSGFALPGVLAHAPRAHIPSPLTGAENPAHGPRAALAQAALRFELQAIGLSRAQLRPLGPHGLLLALPAVDAARLLREPGLARGLGETFARARWQVREIVVMGASRADAARFSGRLAPLAREGRTAVTLLPAGRMGTRDTSPAPRLILALIPQGEDAP